MKYQHLLAPMAMPNGVVLFEKDETLGGQLIHADYAGFKWTIQHFKDWEIRQCQKKGVESRLGCQPTVAELQAEKFDTVVAALGGAPFIPNIPGLTKADGTLAENVFTPISVYGNLEQLGQRVAIIGGGVHPQTEAALQYYGSAPEFYIAGDCAGDGEGSVQKALRSAYGIAMQI